MEIYKIIDFAKWYSGMSRDKVTKAYERYLREIEQKEHEIVYEDDADVTCAICDSKCQIVRPGKWQCPKCE